MAIRAGRALIPSTAPRPYIPQTFHQKSRSSTTPHHVNKNTYVGTDVTELAMAPRSLDCTLLLLSAVLLSCCCGHSCAARPAPSGVGASSNVSFVRAWCAGTEYPALCDATLFPYAAAVATSPARLACAALNETLAGARGATAAMKGMAAGGHLAPVAAEAAGDCVSMLVDAVGMLKQSVEAMAAQAAEEEGQATQQASRMARFRVDSVRTWASAALTDDSMCMEGFKGEAAGVREAVRGHVVGLAHLAANALGIVNAMAAQTPP